MTLLLAKYLQSSYDELYNYCHQSKNIPWYDQRKIDQLITACQFDMLSLLQTNFTSLERTAIFVAKEYWCNNALELHPLLQEIKHLLLEGIEHQPPQIRERKHCVYYMLWTAEDNEEFNSLLEMFEAFLAAFGVLDIPASLVKPIFENRFAELLNKNNV